MKANRRCIVCDSVYNGCIKCLRNSNVDQKTLERYERYRISNNLTTEQMGELYRSYLTVCDTPEHYLIFLSIKEYLAGRKNKSSLMNDAMLLNITSKEINEFPENIKNILFDIPEENNNEEIKENTNGKKKKRRKKYTQDSD